MSRSFHLHKWKIVSLAMVTVTRWPHRRVQVQYHDIMTSLSISLMVYFSSFLMLLLTYSSSRGQKRWAESKVAKCSYFSSLHFNTAVLTSKFQITIPKQWQVLPKHCHSRMILPMVQYKMSRCKFEVHPRIWVCVENWDQGISLLQMECIYHHHHRCKSVFHACRT